MSGGGGCFTEPAFAFDPRLACIQEMVFTPTCAAVCHRGVAAPQGLHLGAGLAFSNLVGIPSAEIPAQKRVAPGDPNGAYIVWKLEGDPRISGVRMPASGPPYLSQAEIDVIREWILRGALDD